MNIVYFGTPAISVPFLERITNIKEWNITGIITQNPKPYGRSQEITQSPVEIFAKNHQLPHQSFESIKTETAFELFKNMKPDLCLVFAFGKIIPKLWLDIPKFGFLNVHPSLLPKHRGPSPLQSTILQKDQTWGISIIKLDEKMDSGDILSQKEYPLSNNETIQDLENKLITLGPEIFVETIDEYLNDKIILRKQDETIATYSKMIEKKDGFFDPSVDSSDHIFTKYKAYLGWPDISMKFQIKDKEIFLKLKEISTVLNHKCENKNTPFCFTKNQLFLHFVNEIPLEIKMIQPEGKKTMDSSSFISGYLLNSK